MSKQVRLRTNTYEDLDNFRSPGQTFTGAVKELLQIAQKTEIEVEA